MPPSPSQEPSAAQKSEQPALRTMKGDVELAITRQKETLVSIALAEKQKKEAALEEARKKAEQEAPKEPAPKRRGRIFLFLVVLLLAGIGALAYFFFPRIPSIELPTISFGGQNQGDFSEQLPPEQVPLPIILTPALTPTQDEVTFSLATLTASDIFSRIAVERMSGDTSWKIKNIIITDTSTGADGLERTLPISTNRLLSLANANAPEIFARSLQNQFMAGLLNEPDTSISTPFFIFKVSGFSTTLAGMLQWEQQLPILFDTVFGTQIMEGIQPNTRVHDVQILGRDARVFEIAPNVGIAYAFATDDTVIVAASRTAIETIIPLLIN